MQNMPAPDAHLPGVITSHEMKLPDIAKGTFRAYFIFDIADTIDVSRLITVSGSEFEQAQLQIRTVATTSYIQYVVPPVVAPLPDVIVCDRTSTARVKIYDYGTVSIRLSFNYSGSWMEFAELTRHLRQSDELLATASQLLADVMPQISMALNKPHKALVEDFYIIEVESFREPVTAQDLLVQYRGPLSQLVLGELRLPSTDDQIEATRVNLSYFDDDLVVIQWDAAFVFDASEGANATTNILEFANTQLVELRTYDARLDSELDTIYKMGWERNRPNWFAGAHAVEKHASRLRSLLVDIRELSDRSSNALKIIGDAFYARLYRAAANRLTLAEWERQVENKINSINEIYRFLTDQSNNARNEFLELIIIALIVVEVIIGVIALKH